MKSVFHLIRLGTVAALLSVVAGCGQKGPLYLPAKPQPAATAPAAQPAPATSSTSESK